MCIFLPLYLVSSKMFPSWWGLGGRSTCTATLELELASSAPLEYLGGTQVLVSFCPTLPRLLWTQGISPLPVSLSFCKASECFYWDLTTVKWLRMYFILISEHWFSDTPRLVRNVGSDRGCSGTGEIVFLSCYQKVLQLELEMLAVLVLFSFKGTLPFIKYGNNLFY